MKFSAFLTFLVFSLLSKNMEYSNTHNSCITQLIAPSNDNPCNATVLGMGTHNGTTVNATTTTNPVANSQCNSTPTRDVWFKSHIQSNGMLAISTTLVGGTNSPGARFALYSTGSCSHLLATNICSNGSEILIDGSFNQEVYIRVWTPFTSSGTIFQIKLQPFSISGTFPQVFPLPIDFSPPNDNPCGAVEINANSTCITTNATTKDATTTTNPSSGSLCNGSASKDIWYKVTIPSSGLLTFRPSNSNPLSLSTRIAVYNGPCSSLSFSGICASNQDIPVTGFPGSDVYIRVWLFNRITRRNTGGNVGICVLNFNPTGLDPKPLPL